MAERYTKIALTVVAAASLIVCAEAGIFGLRIVADLKDLKSSTHALRASIDERDRVQKVQLCEEAGSDFRCASLYPAEVKNIPAMLGMPATTRTYYGLRVVPSQ
jgi:hypothetical protein